MQKNSLPYVFVIFSFVTIVTLVYWPALSLPFVLDDYLLLRFIQSNDTETVLRKFFDCQFPLFTFCRPLGQTYIFMMYKLFGAHSVFFHTALLAIHTVTSFFVAIIFKRLFQDRFMSYCTAFVYAAAVAIHLDPLSWSTVGIYDIGAAFFFFLSFYLFMDAEQDDTASKSVILKHHKNIRLGASCLAYLVGCLFKEAIIFLPIILFAYVALLGPKAKVSEEPDSWERKCIPFVLAMSIILGLKILGPSPLDYPSTHPYAIEFGSWAINMRRYIGWMFQSVMPFSFAETLSTILILFVAFFALFTAVFKIGKKIYMRQMFFLVIWIGAGLLPVIFLSNHTYRYYATYALPAFVGIIFLSVREFLICCTLKKFKVDIALGVLCAMALICSTVQSHRIYREGIAQQTLSDGTNILISRAAIVNLVLSGLQQSMPTVPDDAVFLIGDVDMWAFDKSLGLQFWYNNASIHAYELENLKKVNNQLFVENDISPVIGSDDIAVYRSLTDRSKIFAYRIIDGKLNRINIDQ